MSKEQIASTLRDYRKSRGFSVSDVAEYLESCGFPVSIKTIYGWEGAYSQPNADVLMLLCSLYNIKDVLSAFGYSCVQEDGDPPFVLSLREKQMIQHYRKMPEMQAAVDKLLDLQ